MFIETIDKLVAEFQQRLGTKTSVPWGWFFAKLATLLTRYPTGVTKAIMFSELECSWRKIEKLQSKGGMNSADSLRSIALSKHHSPQAVFHVSFREVKTVEGTHTRIAVVEESNDESSFTMEMYLHKKLYAEVDEIMANGFKLRFTGCRLFHGRRKKSLRLLPSESFVVLLNAEVVENFCQNMSSLEGLDLMNEPQYISSVVKVKVNEICSQESVHFPNGDTANRITIHVTDDVGIQAKFQLWEEYLVMSNLLEEGDTLYIKQCFLVPDKTECYVLEYGPETVIFCQPLTHEQEIVASQKDSSKLLYVSKDNKGMLDCSMYPERLSISEIKQNMNNITLAGQIVSIGAQTFLRAEGIDMVKYEVRVKDESGVCTVVVIEPYKGRTVVHHGQFVLMKNLQVSSDYSMGVMLSLNTDKDGKLWNLSSLQGWLATSSLCSITSLACLDSECSQFVVKGKISLVQSRDREETMTRVHCSCHGQVVEGMDGQLKCEKCQTKGMVEIAGNNGTLKLFNLDGFWSWQYNLCITIMESDECQLQANITNEVGEKILQLPAGQLQAMDSDRKCRVFECMLGQECLYGLSNFKGVLVVSAVSQI